MTGLNFDKYDDIPVEITGDGEYPDPISDYEEVDAIHKDLKANIARSGYRRPTPVQKYAIPILLGGRDLMSCAQTGSGKTAAFLLPMINSFLVHGIDVPEPSGGIRKVVYPSALVLAPTRELAVQIYDESRKFCFKTGLRTVVAYGGAEVKGQLIDLDKGCQVCVATPGRLWDFYERNKIRLCALRYLCLDEADRMLDMGFEVQIRQIVERTDMPDPKHRQTLMFSATFPKPIQRLAQDFMGDYLFITVGRIGSTTDNITQRLEYCPPDNKDDLLLSILTHQSEKCLTLVFVETRRTADTLLRKLLDKELLAACIHGERTQFEREEALANFKKGRTPVLVATDVASRGLDIPNVAHVIQYDLPKTIDDYTHRIGRTGRAGNTGTATAFYNERGGNINREVCEYLRDHNQDVPEQF